jgi:hypothetical protein
LNQLLFSGVLHWPGTNWRDADAGTESIKGGRKNYVGIDAGDERPSEGRELINRGGQTADGTADTSHHHLSVSSNNGNSNSSSSSRDYYSFFAAALNDNAQAQWRYLARVKVRQ